ncbi:MAG: hypothetical protein NTX15_07780 [Candidatus Kapabacteria bacterium]|nr:hypothetical protein [Candidatus Kapabacteria bacterium]
MKGPLVAILSALGISLVNTFVGYLFAKSATAKELNTFLAMVFGSLAGRGVAVVSMVYVALGILKMHQVAFALTFSIASFGLLMAEVFYFHLSMERRKKENSRK